MPAGIAPSDIAVADVNGDGLPDIIVSDQASGDVTVLLNDPAHSFSQSLRFRASTGLYGLSTTSGSPAVSSFAQTVSLVAGDFTGDGRNDLVVVNQGTHSFTVLAADGTGGFANPQLALTTSTSDGLSINEPPGRDRGRRLQPRRQPRPGRADGGHRPGLDLHRQRRRHVPAHVQHPGRRRGHRAVRGPGQRTRAARICWWATASATCLILEGKGDGTFQIQGSRVSLSVVPNLLGPGQAGVLVGNQQNNRVTVQAPSANGNQYTPVQTLGAVHLVGSSWRRATSQWAFLDRGATLPDAIVVSTGSNAVVVYRTTAVNNGVPTFAPAPQTYFVGTAPASVTVADINGDGIPDMLVANQGSNDVSVIFGSYDASGDWVGIPGPRLKSGGDGPIAVIVRDLTGNGVPDLAVVNGGSGTVTLLPGVGRGFFDDQQPQTLFNLGSARGPATHLRGRQRSWATR